MQLRIVMRSYSIRVGPKIEESVLVRGRKRHTETQGRRPREDGDRDWRDVVTSQGTEGSTKNWKRQGRILS